MVKKYISQIGQKLSIAAALAVALCCLPAAAQTSQANEILMLNDKPVTFSEFLKTYPDNDARAKALSPLPRETKRAFRDWEMAQLNKRSAEQDAEMAQLNKRRAEQDAEWAQLNKLEAEQDAQMALITNVNAALDQLHVLIKSKNFTAQEQQQARKIGAILQAGLRTFGRESGDGTLGDTSEKVFKIAIPGLLDGRNPFAKIGAVK